MFNRLLIWCGNHKPVIIHLFYLSYVVLLGLIFLAIFAFSHSETLWLSLVKLARLSGQIGLLFFLAATVPGTLGRLGLRHPFITLGMMFRRHTGVSSFIWALVHASISYLIPAMLTHSPLFDGEVYLTFGIFGLLLLLGVSLTSNNYAVARLGKWWKRIQRLVYVIYWLIFLHVITQKISVWGIVIGAAAILEIISLIFGALKSRAAAAKLQV